MMTTLQESFAARVTSTGYEEFLSSLNSWLGLTIQYRVCEMPIFVDAPFRNLLETSARDIILQCVAKDYLEKTDATLLEHTTVAHQNDRPLFSVVDFAVCQDESGTYAPRLIELQGFPSLFGYQYLFASRMREFYELWETTPFFSGLDHDSYTQLLRSAIYGDIDPEETVLLEIDPNEQKTRPDFVALEKLIGLRTVNLRDVRKVGKGLVAPGPTGAMLPIRRIFNRAIIDELDDLGVTMPFSWNDDLDVQWAGHPNWYFRISKYSLPYLNHPSVPKTLFLSAINELPDNLDAYVLKPLFSFAGKGVVVAPTTEDIQNIAREERGNWVLQERVNYAPCIYTPHGNNRVEIRVMLIWLPDMETPLPVMSLARTGRGAMMGARYNTDPWTGSSGCLFG